MTEIFGAGRITPNTNPIGTEDIRSVSALELKRQSQKSKLSPAERRAETQDFDSVISSIALLRWVEHHVIDQEHNCPNVETGRKSLFTLAFNSAIIPCQEMFECKNQARFDEKFENTDAVLVAWSCYDHTRNEDIEREEPSMVM